MLSRPSSGEYAAYYEKYVSLVSESDVLSVLDAQLGEVARVAGAVATGREHERYADGKWSIREVFGHLIDVERVFGYRAFCFSRGEAAALPSFDENAYVAQSGYDNRTVQDLLMEFTAIRSSNLAFLRHVSEDRSARVGTASGNPVTVRALAFMMAGHLRHHINGLRTSYGVTLAS
jgi:hypothetical protein